MDLGCSVSFIKPEPKPKGFNRWLRPWLAQRYIDPVSMIDFPYNATDGDLQYLERVGYLIPAPWRGLGAPGWLR